MDMHRQPVAQRRRRGARHAEVAIDAARRQMRGQPNKPIATPRFSALRKVAGEVQGAALAGGGPLDRAVMRVNAAHPDLDSARAHNEMVAGRRSAGGNRAGHDKPNAGQRKGAVDRHPKMPRRRPSGARGIGDAGRPAQMFRQFRDALARHARHGKNRAALVTRFGEQRRELCLDRGASLVGHAVNLCHDPGKLGDADQFENVEVLKGLRPRPVIGGDDQQHAVNRQDSGQHVRQKALVSRHIDKAELGTIREGRISKAEIDRQATPLLLRQPVGIDPGQGAHQRGFAVIDMAGRREDHADSDESWATNSASFSRQRKSRMTRPRSIRPITGTGNPRKRRASASSAAPDASAGVRASAALGNNETGKAPLPIWLFVSAIATVAAPSSARATADSSRCANAAISSRERLSSRKAGSRAASRSGSA